MEKSLTKLIFNTSTEIDPLRVEYDRGFRQGVMWVLHGLPHQARLDLARALTEETDVSD